MSAASPTQDPSGAVLDGVPAAATDEATDARRWTWLPRVGTWRYYALLGLVGMGVLGPLGGVTASYMNFSIGFFIGGQVLAGILGSAVTFGYGAQGRHGANYIQTAAASVAGMSAMGIVIQAMTWLGLPQPPVWQLVAYLTAIGMFGVGVGMLYTPLLVDRLQLTFPSGLAVANILRALTDPVLLRRSVSRLATGIVAGLAGGVAATRVAALGAIELSTSTFGAGLIVGARIGVPAIVAGLIGWALVPTFIEAGWLNPGEPFRKITFLIALGMIVGAAAVDLVSIAGTAIRRVRNTATQATAAAAPARATGGLTLRTLAVWVTLWGAAVVVLGSVLLHQPIGYQLFAVALVFVIALVNGISLGITDQNPISSAFVVSVLLMATFGLTDPVVGLLAGTVLLVSTSEACDMQQDRSTGWRLGTDRTIQFRFQMAGIVVGALLSVALAKLFMSAYPVLLLDQTQLAADQQPEQWTSAMTYKLVGALRSLTDDKPYQRTAIALGVAIGLAIELARKALRASLGWQRFIGRGPVGATADFVVDAILLPSPYASSFGGFVNLATSAWFAAGGVVAGLTRALGRRERKEGLPSDMSTASLLGGGLIAGDAIAALGLGVVGLLTMLG